MSSKTGVMIWPLALMFSVSLLMPHLTFAEPTGRRTGGTLKACYTQLRDLFDAGNYEELLAEVDTFRMEFPKSARESSVTFLSAQAAVRLRMLDRARSEAQQLLLKFPHSGYADDARWILAECALMSEQWEKAEEYLGWIVGFSPDRELADAARALLDELRSYLTPQVSPPDRKIHRSSRSRVGLVLPLSGPVSEAAESFLRGYQAAWSENLLGSPTVYDSEGDPVRAVRLFHELARKDSVWGIVGGLGSDEATALAAMAQADRVPFVTTACGGGALAAIGPFAFQGRPDFIGTGRALGRYAMLKLGLVRFGILAPLNRQGRQIVSGFKDAIETSGGEIIAEEVYYPGTRDFSTQLQRIRAIGHRLAYNDSLRTLYAGKGYIEVDWNRFKPSPEQLEPVLPPSDVELAPDEDTTWTLSTAILDSLWEADLARLREWTAETGQEIDSLEVPLDVYQGLLLVIEPGTVEITAPQFARFNLKTRLFGCENWADREALSRVKQYVNGIIYAEPLAANWGEDYYRFVAVATGEDSAGINHYHLAGERAARMMTFAAGRADSPETMRIALSQIRNLNTLSGRVSLLKEERVDRRVTLVRFSNGEYEVVSP